MPDWLNELYNGDKLWIIQVFLIVFTTSIVHLVLRLVLNRVSRHFEKTVNPWDDAMAHAAIKPLLWFVWVMGLRVAIETISGIADYELFQYAPVAHRIAVILLLMMFLLRFIRNAENNFMRKRKQAEVETDEITIRVIARLLRLSVIITAGLVILQTLDISISGVVAFGGIGGIAVGFAAKDLLANFFGGLMIYLDRPFMVGDWVRSPDREIEGTVEDIGWRLTVIRTFDKRPLYIPNSMFMTIAVENPSRMENRRIFETVGLRYCDSGRMRDIVAAVKKMLQQHEDIATDKTLMVNFTTMSASSLDFFIYTFTKTRDWGEYHAVKQDVLLKVIDIVHEHGADIAFPTRTLDGLEALLPRQSDEDRAEPPREPERDDAKPE